MQEKNEMITEKRVWEMPSLEKLSVQMTKSGGTESEGFGSTGADSGSGSST